MIPAKKLERLLELHFKLSRGEYNPDFEQKRMEEYDSLKSKLNLQLEDAETYNSLLEKYQAPVYETIHKLESQIEKIPELEVKIAEQENYYKQLKDELEHYKIHDEDLIKLVTTHQLVSIAEYPNLKDEIKKYEKIVCEIDSLIEMYESLNLRHNESFKKTNDTSLLNTISRNQDHIDELNQIMGAQS